MYSKSFFKTPMMQVQGKLKADYRLDRMRLTLNPKPKETLRLCTTTTIIVTNQQTNCFMKTWMIGKDLRFTFITLHHSLMAISKALLRLVIVELSSINVSWFIGCTIGASGKYSDTSRIGKYGLGFNVCYHLTDVIQFISRDQLIMFDPHTEFLPSNAPGLKLNFVSQNFAQKYPAQVMLPYLNVFLIQQSLGSSFWAIAVWKLAIKTFRCNTVSVAFERWKARQSQQNKQQISWKRYNSKTTTRTYLNERKATSF